MSGFATSDLSTESHLIFVRLVRRAEPMKNGNGVPFAVLVPLCPVVIREHVPLAAVSCPNEVSE